MVDPIDLLPPEPLESGKARIMKCMGMLAGLREVSQRWDAPEAPRGRRNVFGTVLLARLTIAAVAVISLVTWDFRFLYIAAATLGLAIVPAYRYRKYGSAWPPATTGGAQDPPLRPSQPQDAATDPWRKL
jgi:hypothetical protein